MNASADELKIEKPGATTKAEVTGEKKAGASVAAAKEKKSPGSEKEKKKAGSKRGRKSNADKEKEALAAANSSLKVIPGLAAGERRKLVLEGDLATKIASMKGSGTESDVIFAAALRAMNKSEKIVVVPRLKPVNVDADLQGPIWKFLDDIAAANKCGLDEAIEAIL